MPTDMFFDESRVQSRIKTQIVIKYFEGWANVMTSFLSSSPKKDKRIGYIDLFSGPGKYNDQTESTPILVIKKALSNPKFCENLVTIFNDNDPQNIESLQSAIEGIENIDRLKHQPKLFNATVGDNLAEAIESMTIIPSFSFIDPWGYKGLSKRLIHSVVQSWGCDALFFFNYTRINMGINNPLFESHMSALFGEGKIPVLRKRVENMDPAERELTIINEIATSLKEMGMKHVISFRFRDENNERTKHHLIFVSKHLRGAEIMKQIMSKASSEENEGVATFEYNEASVRQPMLEPFKKRPLSDLKEDLVVKYSGYTMSFTDIYENHSVDTPFTKSNYKEALKQLEIEERVKTTPPINKRRKGTFADTVTVSFP